MLVLRFHKIKSKLHLFFSMFRTYCTCTYLLLKHYTKPPHCCKFIAHTPFHYWNPIQTSLIVANSLHRHFLIVTSVKIITTCVVHMCFHEIFGPKCLHLLPWNTFMFMLSTINSRTLRTTTKFN